MDKQTLLQKYGYFDMVQGVTLKAMAQLSDAQLDFRPTPEIKTAKELLSHIFGAECAMAESLLTGQLTQETLAAIENEGVKSKTTADLIAWARNCHQRAKTAIEKATEEQIAGTINAFYGVFPGWQIVNFAYDEHWHHRGQFYTYLRLMGIEPVMLYSYEEFSASA
jgi:Uncharacterized protein conserved in bacteria